VREGGAVAEADERVHDRCRLQHDLDPVVVDPEEEVRLDQLEPLVRERGGVDRDLRPHAPRRVSERVLRRHVLELVAGAAAEGTARAGEDERVDLLRRSGFEALEGGGVLAVDRQEQASAPLPRRQGELAGGDQTLLVGERERDAALERPQRRRQPSEADDRVQHDVGLGALEQLRRVAAHLRQRCEAVDRPAAGRRRDELELRVARDDLERLAADGARSSQESDACHSVEVYERASPVD